MGAQGVVERGLSVRALLASAYNEGARHAKFSRRKGLGPCPRNDHGARRHFAFVFHDLRTCDIQDSGAGRQHHACAEDRFLANPDPFDHNGAGPDEGAILHNDRRCLKRFENTPDAHAATEVDICTDLSENVT